MGNSESIQIPAPTTDEDTAPTLESTKAAIRLFHSKMNAPRPDFNSEAFDVLVDRLEKLKQNYTAATKADTERRLAAFENRMAEMEVQGAPKEEDLQQLLQDWIEEIMVSAKESRARTNKIKKEFEDLVSEIGERIGELEKRWEKGLEGADTEDKQCGTSDERPSRDSGAEQ
jgi:AAA+ ATPase superfamily predicted ATPase